MSCDYNDQSASLLALCARAGSPMQADRLLRGMQKVINHDLPNQMVVLQSLLQLLNDEESDGLHDDGREYVRRLLGATKRASEMVRFLKDMIRLRAFSVQSESVSLEALALELQGELVRLHPATRFKWAWSWNVPVIVGDGRVYVQAMLELIGGHLQPQTTECRLAASSDRRGNAIELALRLEGSAAPIQGAAGIVDQRMDIILAREWLALCGASLEATPAGDIPGFSIVVPNR